MDNLNIEMSLEEIMGDPFEDSLESLYSIDSPDENTVYYTLSVEEIKCKLEKKNNRKKYIKENNLTVIFKKDIPSPKPTDKCVICGYRYIKPKKGCSLRPKYNCVKCARVICYCCRCGNGMCVTCGIQDIQMQILRNNLEKKEKEINKETNKGK